MFFSWFLVVLEARGIVTILQLVLINPLISIIPSLCGYALKVNDLFNKRKKLDITFHIDHLDPNVELRFLRHAINSDLVSAHSHTVSTHSMSRVWNVIHHRVTTTECTYHTVNHHTVTTTECTYHTVNHHTVHRNHHTVNLRNNELPHSKPRNQ